MVDAVGLLVRAGSIRPAAANARAALEAALMLAWLLHADSERRARAYRVCEIRQQINFYRRHDPRTPEGAAFMGKLKGTFMEGLDAHEQFDLTGAVTRPEAKLAAPELGDARRELEALSNPSKGYSPPWHRLFGGAKRLEDVAERVGFVELYQFTYADLSQTVHAADLDRQMVKDGSHTRMLFIRVPYEPEHVVAMTRAVGITAIRLVIRALAPEREGALRAWYGGLPRSLAHRDLDG
jgi:hypothetical protein